MKLFWSLLSIMLTLGLPGPVLASALSPSHVEGSADRRQKTWHATLDLRELPANTRPATIKLRVDARSAARRGATPRVTVALNGLVIGRAWARKNGPTILSIAIEDRLLSTRNHIALAVTSMSTRCAGSACSVDDAHLATPIAIGLDEATAGPVTFAQYVTRFRSGVTITAASTEQRAMAEVFKRALAPHAPTGAGQPAEIVVSRSVPRGTSPALRLDSGPVEIKDRDGLVVFDEHELDALTIVQMTARGDRPVLWVRPGLRERPSGLIELDYGNVALFGADRREIAFSPQQDRAVSVVYASATEREAQLGLYWRLAILAVWLAITAGFLVILRRMPPLKPRAT